VLLFRDIPQHFGIYTRRHLGGWEAFGLLIIVLGAITVLFYIGVIAWMLIAKLFLSKAEVSAVAFYGSATRFDHWLVDILFPH
jgi:hypothetical protein